MTGVALVSALAGCILDRGGLISDDFASGGAGGTVGPKCTVPDDCTDLPEDSTCRQRTCDQQVCGLAYADDGTACSEAEQGECRAGSCLSPDGVPCTAGAQCSSGACSPDPNGVGVCCNSACESGCVSCHLPGLVGTCSPQPSGQDPEDACPEGVCDGSGHCAQGTVLWSKAIGGLGEDVGRGLDRNAAGDIAVGVTFEQSLDVDGTLYNVGPSDATDVMLASFDADGQLGWSLHGPGQGSDWVGQTAIDELGQVVVAGGFTFDLDLGAAPLNAVGGNDAYVAKYSATGAHFWSKSYGISGNNEVVSVAVDAQGNVVVGGFLSGSIDFGGQMLTAVGGLDMFVAKLSPDGDHVWSHSFGTSSNDVLLDLKLGPADEVVIAGIYQETLSFNGASVAAVGGLDGFVAKLDAAGNTEWAMALAGGGDERVLSIHVEPSGDVLVTGDFTSDLLAGQSLMAVSSRDLFVAKLDADGQPTWTKPFGVSGQQMAHAVTGDGWGNVIAAATTDGSIDFGPGVHTSAGGDDVVMAKMDSEGTVLWSQRYGDATDQRPIRLRSDDDGRILVLGEFQGDITFAPGFSHTSVDAFDVFVLSLGP